MNKTGIGINLWRKFWQDKQLKIDASYLPRSRSLSSIYEIYSAERRRLQNSISLDIGPGNNLRNPFGCDEVCGVDVIANPLQKIEAADLVVEPIPFGDNFFDYITAYDFLEHIPRLIYMPHRRLPFIELMNEIWRTLKPGGIFFSHTPIYPYASAFRDPTHVNILTVETFPLYFDDDYKWGSIYGFSGQFKILEQVIKEPHLISILQKV